MESPLAHIPFNQPYCTGREITNIQEVIALGHLSGDGQFTKRCHAWLDNYFRCKSLLVHSCTAALEMAALLAEIGPGDEVIMPSYTFVSTANAFVLRGGVPVFVDVRPDTLNIDERLIEAALTPKTKAIVPVHYAGIPCAMDTICDIAQKARAVVIEDAAQGALSKYKGQPAGSFGEFAALSFHETKNIISGEGGALLINDENHVDRALVIREKGTNRSAFFRGQVDKYTWVDVGSSYLPTDMIAAFLLPQLESSHDIMTMRGSVWNRYHEAFRDIEEAGLCRRPYVPADCEQNFHMYYLLFEGLEIRTKVLAQLKERGINAVFHYIPLHSAPGGKRFARAVGSMAVTDRVSDSIVRLPIWPGMSNAAVDRVITTVCEVTRNVVGRAGTVNRELLA